jgi:nucleoside-diphosphate-sugar epimerase
MPRILILGGAGYIGSAFIEEFHRRAWEYRVLRRSDADYTQFPVLLELLRRERFDFLVNCAGFTGKPNVDACELAKADTLVGNTLLPQTIAHACAAAGVPWGHVSSGCIYSGAKILGNDGTLRVEKDMTRPEMRALAETHPERILGFTEEDTPNFSFRDGPCSFYSGTKALGEEAIAGIGTSYVWRLRIPFDEFDGVRNYLSKVQRYAKVYDNLNSISHRADFTKACLDLWLMGAPAGIYNVTNPGWVTTRRVVERIEGILRPSRRFEYWENDEEFYRVAAKTPRSNCVMDATKLLRAGVKIRPVEEALEHALRNWVA